MTGNRRAVLARIRGHVQGVGFRAWTKRQADTLGVTGWVRNEPDGSVMTLLAGEEDQVAAMLVRLGSGPPGAAVRTVDTEDGDPADAEEAFSVRF